MDINSSIANVLAAIIALGLALRAGVGPVVMYLTEAVKDAIKPPEGWGGLISVIVGMALGVTVGLLAALVTPDSGIGTFMAFGAVAGLFMASGAIESHKAAGQINPEAGAAINVEKATTVQATPMTYRFANTEPDFGYTPYDVNEDPYLGSEVGTGEAEPDDWVSLREDGGHTGQAKEAAPIAGIGEPTDAYKGEGPPPGEPTSQKG